MATNESEILAPEQPPEMDDQRISQLDPTPLGPDSYMWRDFGSYLFHLMLPQAFILQSAHPVINAAVTKDKKYKYDPWGRAKDSTRLLWPIVYARPEKAIRMGRELRELHRKIKGVDANGKKYHALDPEAYSWVHITGFDATVRAYNTFGKGLDAKEQQKMFEEWKQLGSMLGILDRYIPQTQEEYYRYFNKIIEERLEWDEALNDLMDPDFFANYPVPPSMPWLPKPVWKLMAMPASRFMHKLTVATLPENFREKMGIRYSKFDQVLVNTFAWFVRQLYPLLPRRSRYIGLAWKAIKDAEKHPDAYQYNYPSA